MTIINSNNIDTDYDNNDDNDVDNNNFDDNNNDNHDTISITPIIQIVTAVSIRLIPVIC